MRSPKHTARRRQLSIAWAYARNVGSIRLAAEKHGFTVLELVEFIEAENTREKARLERAQRRTP